MTDVLSAEEVATIRARANEMIRCGVTAAASALAPTDIRRLLSHVAAESAEIREYVTEHTEFPWDESVSAVKNALHIIGWLRGSESEATAAGLEMIDKLAAVEAERDRLRANQTRLVEVLTEFDGYTDHQSWRCEHKDRFWENGHCSCGLTELPKLADVLAALSETPTND